MHAQIRAMAASGLQFMAVPEGFFSAAVVPYDPETLLLDADSAVEHLSNKYCGAFTNQYMETHQRTNDFELHCTITMGHFLYA